jgi:tetratricopeptide (TPR) repeat protein
LLIPTETRGYYRRGLLKYQLNEFTSAIKDFTKVIEINPVDADAYYFRGLVKTDCQDYTGAIADYNEAINRGIAKSNLKDFRGAISDFTTTIEIEPTNAMAFYYRGISKIRLDQKDSGCSDLSKAGELGMSKAYGIISKYCN